ncbi:hypothetical protein Tco_0503557 [Tanacetum coccineum]
MLLNPDPNTPLGLLTLSDGGEVATVGGGDGDGVMLVMMVSVIVAVVAFEWGGGDDGSGGDEMKVVVAWSTRCGGGKGGDERDYTFNLCGFAWCYTYAYIQGGVTFIAKRTEDEITKDKEESVKNMINAKENRYVQDKPTASNAHPTQWTKKTVNGDGDGMTNGMILIDNNKWRWHSEWSDIFLELMDIHVPILSNDKDKAVRRCNNGSLKEFSTKQTWEDYKEHHLKGRLMTQDRIF